MLINVKMSTIVVVTLTFMNMLNATPESLKAKKVGIFQQFSFYGQFKFHAQLIRARNSFTLLILFHFS